MESKVKEILTHSCDAQLAEAILATFKEVERNFTLKSWKTSALDAGHFVEAVRRFLEHKLHPPYTDFNIGLTKFSEVVLKKYENCAGDESYRLIIPRILFGIYTIRNKRGVGHIGGVKPNSMDAHYIVSACKWTLAEIIRIESSLEPSQTQRMVDSISERIIPIIWQDGQTVRILSDDLSVAEKVLVLLLNVEFRTSKEMLDIIEYDNITYYKKNLRDLHKKRFIEFNEATDICKISPTGRIQAEALILKESIDASTG